MTPLNEEQESLDDVLESAIDNAETEALEEAPVIEDVAEVEETVAEEVTETVTEPLQAPARWSKEAKDAFESWNGVEGGDRYQQAMLDQYGLTQTYTTQKEQEASQFRTQAEEWNSIFQPFEQQMNLQGTNGPTFMRQLLGYYQQLNNNPAATIQQLAQSYNLDLSTIGQDAPYQSPAEVAQAQRIEQLERAFQNNLKQSRDQEYSKIEQHIQSFANETDASGNPLHPHFEQLRESMTKLVQGGLATDLPSAYEIACKLDPNIQAQVSQSEVLKETARKAANAKKAQVASKRPTGNHSGKVKEVISLDDELIAAIDNQAA